MYPEAAKKLDGVGTWHATPDTEQVGGGEPSLKMSDTLEWRFYEEGTIHQLFSYVEISF